MRLEEDSPSSIELDGGDLEPVLGADLRQPLWRTGSVLPE